MPHPSTVLRRLNDTFGLDLMEMGPRQLADHLLGVYRILTRWGCAEVVRAAGLCHSLYENAPGYWRVTPSRTNRRLLAAIIGARAEAIVYLFPSLRLQRWERVRLAAGVPVFSDAVSGRRLRLSRRTLQALSFLRLANFVEQLAERDPAARRRIARSPQHRVARALLPAPSWRAYEHDVAAGPAYRPERNGEVDPWSSLDGLLAPTSGGRFRRVFWGRAPWHGGATADRSWPELVARHLFLAIAEGAFRRRQLNVFAPSGRLVTEPRGRSAAARRRCGRRLLARLFGDGLHCQIRRVDAIDDKIATVGAMLGAALGRRVTCNAYFTPPGSQTLALHWDAHDVLVVQLRGAKHWTLVQPRLAPFRPYRYGAASSALLHGRRRRRLRMTPGDRLYLPRGLAHEAQAAETCSLHLTFGLYPRAPARRAHAPAGRR